MPINKFSEYTKKFLKPFKAINKRIHEATGKVEMGGNVANPPAGSVESANFREVGKVPEDKSGFPVCK